MTAPRLLERVTRTAALGVRFWDVAAARAVDDGLRVELYPHANPRARTAAVPNRSGVYVAHGVAGLAAFEFGGAGDGAEDEDEARWAAARAYRVEVSDPFGRFLPVAFDADLPARGLFTWRAPWLSPPQPVGLPTPIEGGGGTLVGRVPLFSAPSRPVPEPLAAVQAHLLADGREAAWHLLGVAIDGRAAGLGLADARGRVLVPFPYPEPPRPTLASPPEARNDFTWPVELTAFVPPRGSPPGSLTSPAPAFADLLDVFAALDAPRGVVTSAASPAVPLRLTYRQPLTARTPGAVGAGAGYLALAG